MKWHLHHQYTAKDMFPHLPEHIVTHNALLEPNHRKATTPDGHNNIYQLRWQPSRLHKICSHICPNIWQPTMTCLKHPMEKQGLQMDTIRNQMHANTYGSSCIPAVLPREWMHNIYLFALCPVCGWQQGVVVVLCSLSCALCLLVPHAVWYFLLSHAFCHCSFLFPNIPCFLALLPIILYYLLVPLSLLSNHSPCAFSSFSFFPFLVFLPLVNQLPLAKEYPLGYRLCHHPFLLQHPALCMALPWVLLIQRGLSVLSSWLGFVARPALLQAVLVWW